MFFVLAIQKLMESHTSGSLALYLSSIVYYLLNDGERILVSRDLISSKRTTLFMHLHVVIRGSETNSDLCFQFTIIGTYLYQFDSAYVEISKMLVSILDHFLQYMQQREISNNLLCRSLLFRNASISSFMQTVKEIPRPW